MSNKKNNIPGNNVLDDASLRQLKEAWRQISIDGRWFKKQIKLILLVTLGIVAYITSRYQAQQEIIEEEQLRSELQDWKYKSLTRNSELTLQTRQSQIEATLKNMGDSTLGVSNVPPFVTYASR